MRIAPVTPEMTKMTINKNDIFTFLNHVFCIHPHFRAVTKMVPPSATSC